MKKKVLAMALALSLTAGMFAGTTTVSAAGDGVLDIG